MKFNECWSIISSIITYASLILNFVTFMPFVLFSPAPHGEPAGGNEKIFQGDVCSSTICPWDVKKNSYGLTDLNEFRSWLNRCNHNGSVILPDDGFWNQFYECVQWSKGDCHDLEFPYSTYIFCQYQVDMKFLSYISLYLLIAYVIKEVIKSSYSMYYSNPFFIKNVISMIKLCVSSSFRIEYIKLQSDEPTAGNGWKSMILDIILTEWIQCYFIFQMRTVGISSPLLLISLFLTATITITIFIKSICCHAMSKNKNENTETSLELPTLDNG